ncbi:MAG: dimethylsulfonioproprionate lyase DddP [Pseudomonadota bacterium]
MPLEAAQHPRKIDPYREAPCPATGRPGDDRVEIGPTTLALAEFEEAGLELPDLPVVRAGRLSRLTKALAERNYGGVLMFDPLNIRYATDTTNMQIWNMHNPFRAVLVTTDGYMVLWEYKGPSFNFLSQFNPLVREVRGGAGLFYFSAGDRAANAAKEFAGEVDALMRAHAGQNRRLAVDKILLHGAHALEACGLELFEGEELTERARSIKSPDELKAMRCSMLACEKSVEAMYHAWEPGITENDLWAVLHAENVRRGGEWIETRLLASGPRTNPWFQECGPRQLQNNEIIAFDTDLVGTYGICSDISRTWWMGEADPPAEMRRAFRHAHEHIMTNMEMLKPGVPFRDLTFKGHKLAPEFVQGRYGCMMHGVGLCDEWPLIAYPEDWKEGAFEAVLEPGMCLCVEALVAHHGGDFSIKLEDQVVITETGYENLTRYPFDDRLLA